jgi:hypothetical protein
MRITNIFQRAIQVDGETSTSNYVLAQAVQVRPRFDISPKLRLEGTLEYAMQEFRGDPGIFAGLSASTRDDKLRSAALRGKLSRELQCDGQFFTAAREKDFEFSSNDYVDNIVSGRCNSPSERPQGKPQQTFPAR